MHEQRYAEICDRPRFSLRRITLIIRPIEFGRINRQDRNSCVRYGSDFHHTFSLFFNWPNALSSIASVAIAACEITHAQANDARDKATRDISRKPSQGHNYNNNLVSVHIKILYTSLIIIWPLRCGTCTKLLCYASNKCMVNLDLEKYVGDIKSHNNNTVYTLDDIECM